MNRKKIAIWASLLIAVGFVAWTALSIPDPPEPVPANAQKPKEMVYGQNTIREEIGGKLLWEITTSSTSMDMKTQSTVFKDAKGKYYFPDGKVADLTAPEGSYDSKTKKVKLVGGVTATMSDGTKLTSKELEWVGDKGRLIATGTAHVEQPGMSIDADRIETWEQFQAFQATGNVHMVQDKSKDKSTKGAKAK